MRNLTYIILVIGVILVPACNSNKIVESLDQDGTHFKRTNLLVSNLEKSLTIYRDILGFSIHKMSDSSKNSYSYLVFNIPKEATLRFCTLDSPDQVRTIALTEVTGIELPSPSKAPIMSASVIRVKDLTTVMQRINQLGLSSTQTKIATGSDGGIFTEQAFVDYDGHLIVLYEFN